MPHVIPNPPQVAFRPGAVDLPAGQLMATTHAITMSEKDLASGDLSMIDFEQFVDFAACVFCCNCIRTQRF